MKPSATALGCRAALALALITVTAACGTVGGGAPTAAPPVRAAGPEVATATREAAATDSHTIPAGATAAPGAQMYALLEAHQCQSCHAVGDRGSGVVGPSLNGLAARVETYGLVQSAEAYVYESLVNPAAYLPASCPTGQCANVMPSYADRLSDDELNALVAFLLSLPSESP